MVDKIWSFFIDKNEKAFLKVLLFFVGLGGLLFADYFFRFSDAYITDKKIEQIDKIEEILKTDSISQNAKKELVRLESEVIKRQGFWDFFESFTSFNQIVTNSPKQKNATANPKIPIEEKIIKPEKSVFWHTVSSAWFVFLVMILLPFGFLASEKFSFYALVNIIIIEYILYLSALFGIIGLKFFTERIDSTEITFKGILESKIIEQENNYKSHKLEFKELEKIHGYDETINVINTLIENIRHNQDMEHIFKAQLVDIYTELLSIAQKSKESKLPIIEQIFSVAANIKKLFPFI